MPSKRLMGFWAFMDIALLAAGAIMVAFSQIFGAPNLLINIALRPNFLLSEYLLQTLFPRIILKPGVKAGWLPVYSSS